MKSGRPLTQKRLKEILSYDPDTGVFVRGNRVAGTRDPSGYIRISIAGVKYWAHRLAFMYMTGAWPINFCDHINQKKSDNRWSNLRDADVAQNTTNRGISAANSTGFKGVSRWPRGGFQAGIKVSGKRRYLGIFDDPVEAAKAYDAAASETFGEFASLNFEERHKPTAKQGSLGL